MGNQATEVTKRFQIIDRSVSEHCCFEFTVVDMTKPDMIGDKQFIHPKHGPQFESICECFEKEAAEWVANALNHMFPIEGDKP